MESATPPPVKSRRTLLWVLTSNFGEGLPWSFLHQLVTEFLTAIRASNTQVSSTSLLHLAVTLKFLWSPIVDLFGRLRAWVVAMEVAIGLGMILIATLLSPQALPLMWALLAGLAVLHATHDIACDGLYLQALDRRGQALYSGVRSAPFKAAQYVGSGVLVALAARSSWPLAFGACGVIMVVVAAVNSLVLPRPPSDDSAARRRARAESSGGTSLAAFGAAYKTFLAQPHAVLVLTFMFVYRLGDIMMFAMSKPMLRDIGVDTLHRAYLNTISISVFIVASIVGGGFIARIGFRRCLVPMTYVQNLAIPLYIGLAAFKPSFAVIAAVVAAEQIASGIGNSAHVVFLMRRSRPTFSASHFAFATALVSLGATISGFASGWINEKVGHVWFFTIAFLASVPGLILVLFVPRETIESEIPVTRQP